MTSQLRLLQYRTTYVNGTSILDYQIVHTASHRRELSLLNVAIVKDNSETGEVLKFIAGDKYSIWPSKSPIAGADP